MYSFQLKCHIPRGHANKTVFKKLLFDIKKMAFAIVLWMEEDLHSITSASQVHYAREICESLDVMPVKGERKGDR